MKDLTNGPEGKLIWKFALPMLIGNVFQQSYNLVDSVIVGRVIGKSALAAVGASFPIFFIMVSLVIGVTMGFSILISQYYGAGDLAKVRKTVDTGFIFIFFASLLVTALGLYLAERLLLLLQTPAEIMPQATIFLKIMFISMLPMFGYNSISAVLRGLGDSKTPLYFLIISTALNAALVILFVPVLHWGVAGSAWATAISVTASFIMGIIYLNRSHPVIKFRLRGLEFDSVILKKSLAIGLPTGAQQTFVAAGMMAMTRLVNSFGADTMAAYTAAGRIDTFAVMPAMNLSAAISTFVGQNLGAGKMERIKHGLKAALFISGTISLITTACIFIFSWHLIAFFNTDPTVIRVGARYLFIVGSGYLVFSSMFVFTGALRGAGDTFVPMIITLLALWGVRIPVATILSKRIGTDGIWLGIPVAWTIGLILCVLYYKTGRWKRKWHKAPQVIEPAAEV